MCYTVLSLKYNVAGTRARQKGGPHQNLSGQADSTCLRSFLFFLFIYIYIYKHLTTACGGTSSDEALHTAPVELILHEGSCFWKTNCRPEMYCRACTREGKSSNYKSAGCRRVPPVKIRNPNHQDAPVNTFQPTAMLHVTMTVECKEHVWAREIITLSPLADPLR